LSPSVFFVTNTFNVADVIVAPSGRPDVSNRSNGTMIWYSPYASLLPAVMTAPDTLSSGVPTGG